MTSQFFEYWIRDLGLSFRFFRIHPIDQSSVSEKMMAALMIADAQEFRTLISNQQAETVWVWLSMVMESGSARTTLSRLIEFNLFESLPAPHRAQLMRIVTREAADRNVSDEMFVEILKILAKFKSDIVWIKGSSLARTLYRGDNFRSTGDFDIVVRPGMFQPVVEELRNAGFVAMTGPGSCNQVGVGPTKTSEDLSLSPNAELIASSAVAMSFKDWPFIDIKLGPFDSGIQMRELDRFFDDAFVSTIEDCEYLCPSLVDHLMISLHNFAKDRFVNWKNLFDIHLLAAALQEIPTEWKRFIACCKTEHIESIAWAGLTLAKDRFKSIIPDAVFDELAPKRTLANSFLMFTVSPYFVWNATSLPMMVLNAVTSSNRTEKMKVLQSSFFPSKQFLSAYYGAGKPTGWFSAIMLHVAHWSVLILPGGLVRRTFGKIFWPG